MMLRLAMRVLGYAALFGTVGLVVATRFSNPALTETQLFLALWPLFFVCMAGIALIASGETRPK